MKKNNLRFIDWKRMLPELQRELDKVGLNLFSEESTPLNEDDFYRIKRLENRLLNSLYIELQQKIHKFKAKSIKNIILDVEVLPFQLATRSNDITKFGKPWEHDGSEVNFKLQSPHDKLEIYSPKGEFLCSYPVQVSGEIKIDDLEPGVYLLYLRGRKIKSMVVNKEQNNF